LGSFRGQSGSGGMRWMPRRHGPMKGVASCEKRRWAAGRQRTVDTRMGQPGGRHGPSPLAEHIGEVEVSGGTETSQYPEEQRAFP